MSEEVVSIKRKEPISEELLSIKRDERTVIFHRSKCLGCGICSSICNNCTLIPTENKIIIQTEECNACGLCAINCPFNALELQIHNQKISVDEWAPNTIIPKEPLIRLETCISCKQCADVCPQNAIEVSGTIDVISSECTLCGSCVDACPTGALQIILKKSKWTHQYSQVIEKLVEIDATACILCKACEHACPLNLIKLSCLHCPQQTGDATAIKSLLRVEKHVKIDTEKCIWCGRCVRKCPTHSIEIKKPLQGELSITLKKCQEDCTICIDMCPCKAIEKTTEKEITFHDTCFYCGLCARVCPTKAITYTRAVVNIVDINGNIIMEI
ncbi:MAG: 4Fe-4S binding protein [Candidatus Helarchaeota archaeon]